MREFPQTSVEFNLNPLLWVVPLFALILVSLAVIQWRKKRKAAVIDSVLWIGAALFIMLVTFALSDRREVWENLEPLWPVLLLVAVIGCAVSWIRLWQQEQPRDLGSSLLMSVVLVVLVLLLTPALQQARETGHGTPEGRCKSNLHIIGLALYNYNDDQAEWPLQQTGDPPHSWRVDLLPYVDSPALHEEYDYSAAWNADVNRKVMTTGVPWYTCPAMDWPERGQPMPTAYALLVGDGAAWSSSRVIDPDDIPDGAANTAIVAEACGLNIIWTEPRDIDLAATPIGINLRGDAPGHSPGILSTYHAKGANVLMADGSVRSLAIETDRQVLEAITTADRGEDVGDF